MGKGEKEIKREEREGENGEERESKKYRAYYLLWSKIFIAFSF